MRVGISGWNYPSWRGRFYPDGLPHRAELSYAASTFDSIEINSSFYRLQTPQSYARWAAQAPSDFVFAVKGSRYITHMMRLGSSAALANFFASGVLALEDRLGPVLWQLPANMTFDEAVVRSFVSSLPRTTAEAAHLAESHDERLRGRSWFEIDTPASLRHAMEVRHESFRDERFVRILREYGVSLVVADSAGKFPQFDAVTSELVYVRLHGAEQLYTSRYDDATLLRWAQRIRRWAADVNDVVVYFDNDALGHAPFDALRLRQLLTLDRNGRTQPDDYSGQRRSGTSDRSVGGAGRSSAP